MRERRGRGEGSIYQRKDGQWCASVTAGYDERGKQIRRVLYGKTKRQVHDKLTELHARAADGLLSEPHRFRLGQYLDHWLEDAARPKIRNSTYRSYEGIIRNHIKPHLGGSRLAKLQPSQVQNLYTRLRKDGVSPRVRALVHAVLHKSLGQAVKWGYLARNPCDAVERPRAPNRPMQVWDQDQVTKFLKAAQEDRLFALYVLALGTGLRQGELFGLQWQDVNLKSGMLFIQRAVYEHAQISLTLDTYSHVLPSMQKEAAERLDELFAKLSS